MMTGPSRLSWTNTTSYAQMPPAAASSSMIGNTHASSLSHSPSPLITSRTPSSPPPMSRALTLLMCMPTSLKPKSVTQAQATPPPMPFSRKPTPVEDLRQHNRRRRRDLGLPSHRPTPDLVSIVGRKTTGPTSVSPNKTTITLPDHPIQRTRTKDQTLT